MRESRLSVKPVNPDNISQVRRVVQLFSKKYGDLFPHRSVYNEQFWTTHIQSRFCSLGIYDGKKMIGHVAVQPDPGNPGTIQILYPVFDTPSQDDFISAALALKENLERMSERQEWQAIYFFCSANDQELQRLAVQFFGTTPVAIIPDYFEARGERNGAIVFAKSCQPSTGAFYHPTRWNNIVHPIANSLNLELLPLQSEDSSLLSADWSPLERQLYRNMRVSFNFVCPSLLNDYTDALRVSEDQLAYSNYFLVELRDQKCEEFCSYLEDRSFTFCGVLPLLRGRYSAFYTSSTFSDQLKSQLCTGPVKKLYRSLTVSTDNGINLTGLPHLSENIDDLEESEALLEQ